MTNRTRNTLYTMAHLTRCTLQALETISRTAQETADNQKLNEQIKVATSYATLLNQIAEELTKEAGND